MSATPDSDNSSSPYRRDNYWGRDDDPSLSGGGHAPTPLTTEDQATYKAHKILRDVAPFLCGRSLEERGEKLELSDPSAYPPADPVADQRHAARVNKTTGDMNFGYSTWVQLDDLPTQQFYEVVEDCLTLWQLREGITDDDCNRLREYAKTEKSKQETDDDEIIARMIAAILHDGTVENGLEWVRSNN